MHKIANLLRVKAWGIMVFSMVGAVLSLQGQVASNDVYSVTAGSTLTVSAPGVLSNDTSVSGYSAILVSGPANGLLTLNADGSFTYTPTNNFTGVDGFTYQDSNGSNNSGVASVVIMVLGQGELFHDDFSRPTASSSIFPWTRIFGKVGKGTQGVSDVGGTWGLTNGVMIGTGTNYTYGYTYCGDTNWTDYSVQGQFRFSRITAASAGLVGRLNPVTGAHYAVWIYPENSDEYNIPPVGGIPRLWLYKYSTWTIYTNIGQWSSLSLVGTNWHNLKLTFQGNNISAYFDGNLVTNVTDDGFIDGTPAYSHGSMGLNLWISMTPYLFSVDNLIVTTTNPPAAAVNDSYSMTVATGPILNVPAPGVLANDTGSGALTAALAGGPAHGNLTLTNNGGFTYTPTNNFTGIDSFTYRCTDGQTTSGVATATIAVSNLVFDLAIGMTGAATVPATSNLTYTISVTNKGPASAGGVTVTDALPAGVSFVSASGNWVTNGGVVIWNLGTLTSSQVSNLTLTITAPVGGILTNVASVGPLLNDTNPTNNATSPVITTVTPLADVRWGDSGPAGVAYGMNFNYAISVSNVGPSTASGVSVTDNVPAGLVFVAASVGWTTNGNQVVWTNLGSLVSGATTNLTLTVGSMISGIVTNIAGGGSQTSDPDPTNNQAAPVVTIITKSLPPVTWGLPANIEYGTVLGAGQNNATSAVPGTAVYSPTNGAVLPAGTNVLQVVYTPADTNYVVTNLSVQLVVTPASLTVTANDTNKTYGQTLTFAGTEISSSGLVNGDMVGGAEVSSAGAMAGAGVNGSPYSIVVTNAIGSGLSNYTIGYVNGQLTVNAAGLAVVADNTNRVYGAANPGFTARYVGLVNGEEPDVLTGAPGLTTAAATNSPVGDYVITNTVGTLNATNYLFSFTNGILTVTPASLTVAANDTNKSYGQTLTFAGTEISSSGLVNGDEVDGAELSSAGAAATAGVVGSPYPISVTNATGAGLANYTISYQPGTLTVNPATLAVAADDQTRMYSLTNPVLTASYTGFANNDDPNTLSGVPLLNTPATAASPVGDYPITVMAGTLSNANYSFIFTNGTLTVTAAPAPVISAIGLTNQVITVTWSSVVGATYGLQSTTNLFQWDTLATNPPAAGTTASQTHVMGDVPWQFYRVLLLPAQP